MTHLKDASYRLAQASLANIKLGWKGLLGTNTLAYYEQFQIADLNKFDNVGS
jgi:hypothetical protein